jgi:hypothetical protein
MTVVPASAELLQTHLADLAELLIACVAAGASVSFLAPLAPADARRFWRSILTRTRRGEVDGLVATENGRLVGCVFLVLATPANQQHRAEVTKLLVHPGHRSKGVGAALMTALEDQARRHGRSLLTLDTAEGTAGERLYARLGYRAAGVIPGYARLHGETFAGTTVMYKQLA